MAGRGQSRRISVSGLLVDGDLIDLDQPADAGLLKEDGFLLDSELDSEIFKASPPKPTLGAPAHGLQKDESPVESKPKTRRGRNKMRSSMAWDQAFQVDESALFLRDPLDPPLVSEPPAPPRTTKRPAAIDVPRKSIQESEGRPVLRSRTPDSTPFSELRSNTPIPDAEPSPVQLQSGGKRRKDGVQESMAWNRAFQEENQGFLTDVMPLAESPVIAAKKRSSGKGSQLQESSDSCTTAERLSRPALNTSSMAWDRAFQSSEGVLDPADVEPSGEIRTVRSSDQVSQSVRSSVESLMTEASTSSVAWSAMEDDEAESGGVKGAQKRNAAEGVPGHLTERTSTPVKGTPTKGDRRRKQLAGLHRPTSATVAIEAAIQHGTRLRLPGRYNPNPLPPKTPQPSGQTPNKQRAPLEKSPKIRSARKDEFTTERQSATNDQSAKENAPGFDPGLRTKGVEMKYKSESPQEKRRGQRPGSSGVKPGSEQGLGAGNRGSEQGNRGGESGYDSGLVTQKSSEYEALQAQLAEMQRERNSLLAKVAKLEASTGELEVTVESTTARPQNPVERKDGTERNAVPSRVEESREEASRSRRPETRPVVGSLPRGSSSQPMASAHVRLRVSPKGSPLAPTVEPNSAAAIGSVSGARPSFLKKPTAKRDFFQAPTVVPAPSPVTTSVARSGVGSALVASPGRQSRASASVTGSAGSAAEALKVPSARQADSLGALPPGSALPKPSQNSDPKPALPRYKSLLRRPSVASGLGQNRSLKPGAFSASAVQAACSVPLPSSPAGKLDLATPSPVKKLGARKPVGVSSPAASRLRRSGDQPVTAPPPGDATKASQGTKGIPGALRGDPPVANAFLSKLGAASGGVTRIPPLKTSRLKPPGEKPPGVTSALPRPSKIDPALVAAACTAPLPPSPKASKPRTLLPRGSWEAPGEKFQSTSGSGLRLPVASGRSLLRLPSNVTSALIRAACAVPLPPSPRRREAPLRTPEQPLVEVSDTLSAAEDGLMLGERTRDGVLGSAGPEKGGAEIGAKPRSVEDGECFVSEGRADVAAEEILSSCVVDSDRQADVTCPPSEPSSEDPAPPNGSATEEPAPSLLSKTDPLSPSPADQTLKPLPLLSPPRPDSEPKISSVPADQTLKTLPLLSPPKPESETKTESGEATASSVPFPSLQLPPDSCSQARRLSRKPNLPTIYSPARGLFTAEGDQKGGERRPPSPVARALFSSMLGKAVRVSRGGEDEAFVSSGVEDGIPAVSGDGSVVSSQEGSDENESVEKPGDSRELKGDDVGIEPSTESASGVLQCPEEATGPSVQLKTEPQKGPENFGGQAADNAEQSPEETPEEVSEEVEQPAEGPSPVVIPGPQKVVLSDHGSPVSSASGDGNELAISEGSLSDLERPAVSLEGTSETAAQGLAINEDYGKFNVDRKAGLVLKQSGVTDPTGVSASGGNLPAISGPEVQAGFVEETPKEKPIAPASNPVPTFSAEASLANPSSKPLVDKSLPGSPQTNSAVSSPASPTAKPEVPAEPEMIASVSETPTSVAVIGGGSDLFARLRARQAAVEAMLNSPLKTESTGEKQVSPVQKKPLGEGRLECPAGNPGEQLECREEKDIEAGEGDKQSGSRQEEEVQRVGVQAGAHSVCSQAEVEGKGKEMEFEAGENGDQPGCQTGETSERAGIEQGESEVQPGAQPGVKGSRPDLVEWTAEREIFRNQTVGEDEGPVCQPGDGRPVLEGLADAEFVTGGFGLVAEGDAADGDSAGAQSTIGSGIALGSDGSAGSSGMASGIAEEATQDSEPPSLEEMTSGVVAEAQEQSPVVSPGALTLKSPVSAAWEEAWFGTPVRKAGPVTPGNGVGLMCPTKKEDQSPGEEVGGDETFAKSESIGEEVSEPAGDRKGTESGGKDPRPEAEDGERSPETECIGAGTECPVDADVTPKDGDGLLWKGSGDSDRAPEVQSADALFPEAPSAGGFTPRISPGQGGRGSGRKPSPKTPNPILSLAIPPPESPQTPDDEPRQTLESQFEDQAKREGIEAQWELCLGRIGGRTRSSPASLPRGPPSRRTPLRHSAEDLWNYLAPGRSGSPRGTPTRVSPVSVITRTPRRLRDPLSESAPGLAGLMQSVMDGSARKEEKPGTFASSPGLSSSPVVGLRGKASARKKKPVLSPVNVSWDGEELEARIKAIEAAGEGALSAKSGRVQSSPPDKKDEPPVNPYSPVKKKECGPFDCTKKSASW